MEEKQDLALHTGNISSHERESAIETLAAAYAEDVLDMEEYERRLELIEAAQNRGEVQKVIADLVPAASTSLERDSATSTALVPIDPSPKKKSLVSVFSSITRKRSWHVPRHMKIKCVFGSVDLDFTEAVMVPGQTDIEVKAIFGSAQIVVPSHVNVEMDGVGVFGTFEDLRSSGNDQEPAPYTLRVTGKAVFGSVEVRERTLTESLSSFCRKEVRKQLESKKE